MTNRELRQSVRCLINRARAQRGLDSLTINRSLRRAATGHSRSMVRHRFFSHGDPGRRLANAGYFAGADSYFWGENIAAGRGRRGSPSAIFRGWMRSPPHRANILSGRFRDIGVGVAHGDPGGGGSNSATYTVDFGVRN